MNPVQRPIAVSPNIRPVELAPLPPSSEVAVGGAVESTPESSPPAPEFTAGGPSIPVAAKIPSEASVSALPDSALLTAQEPPVAQDPPETVPPPVSPIEIAKALPVSEPPANLKPVDYSTNPLAGARETLEAFLNSPNWKQRIKYVKLAKDVAPIMAEYYQENADGPTKIDSIDYLTSGTLPDGQGKLNVFHVAVEGKPAFPVVVEEGPDGNKIDWQIFVEFKDLRLPRFFEKFSEKPGEFRVVMTRSHYFGSDVPNQDGMLCFCVEPPIKGYKNHVWVDKDNAELLEKLGARKDWGVESAQPIVSLRWVKDASGAAYVMLDDILADNWRTENLATGPRAVKGPKVSQVR
jgi:hypothetical protein